MMRNGFDAELRRRASHFEEVELPVVDLIVLAAHEDARRHVSFAEPLGDDHDLLPVERMLHRAPGCQMFPYVGRDLGHPCSLDRAAFAVNMDILAARLGQLLWHSARHIQFAWGKMHILANTRRGG